MFQDTRKELSILQDETKIHREEDTSNWKKCFSEVKNGLDDVRRQIYLLNSNNVESHPLYVDELK